MIAEVWRSFWRSFAHWMAKIETDGTIIFVANVGEEGLGDLRGVRHLFSEELKGRATHFISVDGVGLNITNTAVGVVRYRATFHGPGGHSYGAFGLPRPFTPWAELSKKSPAFRFPHNPKPHSTSADRRRHVRQFHCPHSLDGSGYAFRKRSGTGEAGSGIKRAVQGSVDEENQARPYKLPITIELKIVSQRPAGLQPADSPIVKTALAAGAVLGVTATLTSGSTDSNIPISLKIPAITIDGGGEGKGAHSLDESFDTTNSHVGTQRVLLTALGIVGVK